MASSQRKKRKSPEDIAVEYITRNCDQDHFRVEHFGEKGRGIVATKKIEKGDFLLYYHGNLLSGDEGDALEEEEESGYRFFFSFGGKDYCIDATEEPQSGPIMGRLVNHGKKQEINSRMKTIVVNGEPKLCLFSIKSIESGQEILYDYGIHPPWESQSNSTNKGLQQSHRNTHLEKLSCNEVFVQDFTAQQKQGGNSVPDSDGMGEMSQSSPSSLRIAMPQNPQISHMGEKGEDIEPGSNDIDEKPQSLPLVQKEAMLQNPQISHMGEKEADIPPDSGDMDEELQSFPLAQKEATLQNPQISQMREKEADIPPDSDDMDEVLQSWPSAKKEEMLQNPQISHMGEREADIPPDSGDMDEMLQSLPSAQKEAMLQNPQISQMREKEAYIPPDRDDMEEVLQSLPSAQKEAMLQNPQISHMAEREADIPPDSDDMDEELQSFPSAQKEVMLQNPQISHMGEKEADIPPDSGDMDEVLQSFPSAQKEAMLQIPQISHMEEREAYIPPDSDDMDGELQSLPSAQKEAMLQNPQISHMGEEETEIVPDSDDMDEESQSSTLMHKKVMLQNLQISNRGEISFFQDTFPLSSSSSLSDSPIDLSTYTVYDPSDVSCSSDLDQNFSLNQNVKERGYLNLSDVSLEMLHGTSDSDDTYDDNPLSDSDDGSVYEPDKEGPYSSDSDCSAYEVAKVKVKKFDDSIKESSNASDREVQQPTALTPADVAPAAAKVQETNDVTISEPTSSSKSVTYKKPYRMCKFCNTFKSKLSQHIATQHHNVKEVSIALKLPRKESSAAFDAFKKEGILQVNKSEAKQSSPQYHREKTTGKGVLVLCNICSGFFSKTYITRHANKCLADSEGCKVKASIPVTLLDCDEDYGGDFMRDILSRFRADEIGQLCTTDPVLVKIGRRLWYKQKRKADKSIEVRKSVMTDMRRLAALYLQFDKAQEILGERPVKKGNISDLFQRTNFQHFEMAVDEYTSRDSGSDLKAGLKMALYYLLKTASKVLKATHLTEDEDDQAEDIDKFVAVLELNYNYLFGDASYKINKQRQVKLRKPDSLPEEEDIKRLRDYTLENMNQIVEETELALMDSHKYATLRDLVVSRLTLFNARRGGEPSRLLLEEWNEAESGAWLDKSKVDNLDPIDSALIGSLKITYQSGKGNNHLVPVLFPVDTIGPIRKLCNKENRSLASVAESNPFSFPSINNSDGHVSGWHSVNNVCSKIDLTDKSTVTATKNRHRVSTMFAMMDIPLNDRQYVYKHLGHTEGTNVNIYQTPLALKELTVVGRRLQAIDNGQTSALDEGSPTQQTSKSSLHDKPSPSSTQGEPPSPDRITQDLDTSFPSSPSFSLSAKSIPAAGGLPSARSSTRCDSTANPKVRKYYQWSHADAEKVVNYFHDYFKDSRSGKKKLPGKKEILLCKERCGLTQDWKTIHSKVMNEVRKCNELARKRQESWN